MLIRGPSPAAPRVRVDDVDREHASRHAQDRRAVEKARDRFGVERGAHDDQQQILAQALAHLAQHRERQVGVDGALVKLVEHHAADAGELGIAEELAREDALGDDAQARARGDAVLEAHLVADLVPDAPVLFFRDPFGGGAGGDAAGLEHDKVGMRRAEQSRSDDRRGNARGLAGAGFGDEHQRAMRSQRAERRGQVRIDRQWDHCSGRGVDGSSGRSRMTGSPGSAGGAHRPGVCQGRGGGAGGGSPGTPLGGGGGGPRAEDRPAGDRPAAARAARAFRRSGAVAVAAGDRRGRNAGWARAVRDGCG